MTTIHNLLDMSMDMAYAETQTNDSIKSGDFLLVEDGIAMLDGAYPVMLSGTSGVFHAYHDTDEGREQRAAALARYEALEAAEAPAPAAARQDIILRTEDGLLFHGDELMLHIYPAGDCDTACWPLKSDMDRLILARALYDHFETSDFWFDAAILPDGTRFVIEDELIKNKAVRAAADSEGF